MLLHMIKLSDLCEEKNRNHLWNTRKQRTHSNYIPNIRLTHPKILL